MSSVKNQLATTCGNLPTKKGKSRVRTDHLASQDVFKTHVFDLFLSKKHTK